MKGFAIVGCLTVASLLAAQQPVLVKSPVKNLGTASAIQVKKVGTAKLSESAIRVVAKPKLTFTPLALTENGKPNGKAVDPNLVVRTSSGNAKSKDLLDGTNALEQSLNNLGYSLYSNENDKDTPIVPVDAVVKGLSSQATALKTLGGMNGFAMPKSTRTVSKELSNAKVSTQDFNPATGSSKAPPGGIGVATRPGASFNPALVGTKTVVMIKTVDKKNTLFDKSFGDPEWFAVDFNSGLTRHADMKKRQVTAHADIKATLLGKTVTLFHAKAEAIGTKDLGAVMVATGSIPGGNPPKTGGGSSSSSDDVQITLEAELLGDDLFSPVSQKKSGKVKRSITNKSVGWEYSIHIPIIPAVNIVGTIGAKGSMGLNLVADADSTGGEISIVPSFNTAIYAQAGVEVNLLVVSAEGGLGAELTLIDYELDISAGVTPSIVNINDDSYVSAVTPILVKHTLNTLSGKVYGYAKIEYWVPFKTHEKMLWKGDLFKWSGFTDSRTLLSEGTDGVIIGKSPMKLVSFSGG